jgi:hypothetical protein
MAKWRMSYVMGQTDRLDEVLVRFHITGHLLTEPAPELCDLEGVRQSRSVKIAFSDTENSRLSLESAECRTVYDPGLVNFEFRPVTCR